MSSSVSYGRNFTILDVEEHPAPRDDQEEEKQHQPHLGRELKKEQHRYGCYKVLGGPVSLEFNSESWVGLGIPTSQKAMPLEYRRVLVVVGITLGYTYKSWV